MKFPFWQASQNDSEKKESDLLSSILTDSESSQDCLSQNPGTSGREEATRELSDFMKFYMNNMRQNLLRFWKENATKLPLLNLVSRVLLSPLPTSSASEVKFKIGKLIQKDQPSLRPKNLGTLVFMIYNLREVGYSFNLPPTPPGFAIPNAMYYEEARAQSGSDTDFEDELDSID